MNEENTKNIILTVFIVLVIAASAVAIIYNIKPTISDLRSNSLAPEVPDSFESGNTTKPIQEEKYLKSEMNINENIVNEIKEEKNNFETEVASYSTTIYDTEESRIHNIKIAIDKLTDAVINSGEEFSFNNTLGPMGPNEGYEKATGFDGHGKKIKIYAGGMCQISSTLYNTALIAGLEITERHAHSSRVYYVPKDKDATIMYGGADLKFKNNTPNDLKIVASTDGHEVTIKLFK